uniref:Actin n=1 Tax=Ditylum brightwellii TaxID=49249 RepID=A0A7S1ZHT0_9STRA|mmetsp:Transcript_32227/g.48067  ORF Transcript_32227/g.48067 Transcript_32227/m.48067 type:complete len:432 (+) Transcript_32227:82-1377(+)
MHKPRVTSPSRLHCLMHGKNKDNYCAIVLDFGSGYCKAGFTNDDKPRTVFPSVIKYVHDTDDIYVGDEDTFRKRYNNMTLRRPIHRGIVTNWDDIERMWKHAFFNELRANTTQHPILLTAPFLSISVNAKAYRERVARILLEKFDAPAIDFVDHSVLALYANGSTTGCVVDSGYDVTSIVPIYEGYVLQHATRSINLGGIDITKYLRRLLVECSSQSNQWIGDGNDSNKQNNLILCDIKHTLCYVALDYEEEMAKTSCALEDIQKPYVLPNMESVMIGAERFQCPEIMFQPDLIGLADEEGIADSVVSAIGICVDGGANNEQLQRELYANVTLAGGNTLFPGMEERVSLLLSRNFALYFFFTNTLKHQISLFYFATLSILIHRSMHVDADRIEEKCSSIHECEYFVVAIGTAEVFFMDRWLHHCITSHIWG